MSGVVCVADVTCAELGESLLQAGIVTVLVDTLMRRAARVESYRYAAHITSLLLQQGTLFESLKLCVLNHDHRRVEAATAACY